MKIKKTKNQKIKQKKLKTQKIIEKKGTKNNKEQETK